jgi:hypothetical protein
MYTVRTHATTFKDEHKFELCDVIRHFKHFNFQKIYSKDGFYTGT